MVNSPFDKFSTWLVAIIIWFVSFWGMYGQSDILHTNFLLIYSVTIGCTGGYLLIVYLIYKHDKKVERKNEERAKLISKKYPNAYEAYLADSHISRYNYKSIASINDSDWEKREKVASALNKEYNHIKYKYYRGLEIWTKKHNIKKSWLTDLESSTKRAIIEAKDEIIDIENKIINDEWTDEQSKFSSLCRDLRDELTPEFGCYNYKIKLPVDNNTCVNIWQLFANSYCLDNSLDYSFNDSYIKKAELVESHRSFQYEQGNDKLCNYINKLNEEDEVSVYINLREGWPEFFVIDFIESIIEKLENKVPIERILIDPLPNIYKGPGRPEPTYEEWINSIKRRVVIIDINTENKQLKTLCDKIEKKAITKRPLLVYFSFFKCFSKEEMKELIEKHRKEEEERKKEEEARLEQIKKLTLDEIPDIDQEPIAPDFPEDEYRSGVIITDQVIVRVNYDIPQCDDKKNYSYYTAPSKYNVVFPYRRRKKGLRGYTEVKFENRLKQELNDSDNYLVLGDVSILPSDGYHPFEPDIAIVEKNNKYGLRVDIEIDEPYSGYNKEPIHYLGCGDEFRDKSLANIGWLVIRFAENQVYKEPYACICYIKQVISQIDKTFLQSINGSGPKKIRRWTEFDAKRMILYKSREQLLRHEFNQQEVEKNPINARMTDFEKEVAAQVNPLYVPTLVKHNIDNSTVVFPQDSDLQFEPNEHVYIYKGHNTLDAVSSVINKFFKPFDSFRISLEMSMKRGQDQDKLLEEWDFNGQFAREIGTFMHSQIDAYFSGKEIQNNTHFTYKGVFENFDRDVSIEEEISQFKDFLNDYDIKPFRTEWHIFDPTYKIAGTIDLLCRNGASFDIYDWKRSYKASPDEIEYNYGINGLEHIPDISFYHYALQQNLYKYILERNYNIKVKNMYIVVMHPNFTTYFKYKIPQLENEIKVILKYVGEQKGIIGDTYFDKKSKDEIKDVVSDDKPVSQIIDGHECVDLGLSVKWASFNIGAAKPEEYGDYYAWGEVSPKQSYYWINYRLKTGGDDRKNIVLSKYNTVEHRGPIDNITTLKKSNDAASVIWGGSWRMPTQKEFRELIDNCRWDWSELNGIQGYKIHSRIPGYMSKSIFLPASGYRFKKEITFSDSRYWSSDVDIYSPTEAEVLIFKDKSIGVSMSSSRFVGAAIRPVCN